MSRVVGANVPTWLAKYLYQIARQLNPRAGGWYSSRGVIRADDEYFCYLCEAVIYRMRLYEPGDNPSLEIRDAVRKHALKHAAELDDAERAFAMAGAFDLALERRTEIMTNIDHADLAKLLRRKRIRTLILHLPASPSYGEHGWQLILIEEVPLRAAGRQVGTLNRYHVVDVEPDERLAAPEHTLHVTYGEAKAYRHLILAEIAAAKRTGDVPRLMLRPTQYGVGDDPVVGHINDQCSRLVYTFAAYSADVYLSVFGNAEPSDKWGAAAWNSEPPSCDVDSEVRRYTLARSDGL